MKKLLFAGAAFLTMFFGCLRPSNAEVVYNGELVNDACIGADTNYDLNLQRVGATYLSFTAAFSTTTPSSKTFTDGIKSTATITVSSNTALTAQKAWVQLRMVSASSATYSDVSVTLNGIAFREGNGKEWLRATTATGTAVALAAAIDANSNFDAVAVSTIVYASSTVAGKFANSWTASASSPLAIATSAPAFVGGFDNARLAINGVVLDQGVAWTASTVTSSATAKAISDAIMANTTLNAIMASTWTAGGVVTATATTVGVNAYTLYSSTSGALRLNGSATANEATFLNGTASVIDLTTELITVPNHGYGTGLDVLYTTSPATSGVTPLNNGTTYYVIKTNYDQIKLATSKANAAAGTAINLSAVTGGGTYTLTPMPRSGNPSFKWQTSNNSTFVDIPSISSATITVSDTAAWNFGNLPYKTLRLKYTAPTNGCASVTATGTGTR